MSVSSTWTRPARPAFREKISPFHRKGVPWSMALIASRSGPANNGMGCWVWYGGFGSSSLEPRPNLSINKVDGYVPPEGSTRTRRDVRVAQMICHLRDGIPYDELFTRVMNAQHTCDNGWCVNPDHIFWDTFKQNLDDKLERQVLHHRRPYTTEEVRTCYWLLQSNLTIYEIMDRTGIRYAGTAYNIGLLRSKKAAAYFAGDGPSQLIDVP